MGPSARVHLRQISLANHCTADWNAMTGSAGVRHCGSCKKNVYNLSEMTEDQAQRLLDRSEDVCVRYYHRADGTIVTSACSPSSPRQRSKLAAGMAAAVTYGAAFAGLHAAVDDVPQARSAATKATGDDGLLVAMGGIKINIRKRPDPSVPAVADVSPGLRSAELAIGKNLQRRDAASQAAQLATSTIARAECRQQRGWLAGLGALLLAVLTLGIRRWRRHDSLNPSRTP